ncbi:MAG: hypothetical protein OHK0032_01210 [Thermodesulfovibrionales bacterium]
MKVEILERKYHNRGEIFIFGAVGKTVEVLFLSHAIGRILKWGLTFEMIGETLLFPDEVLIGHNKRYIAHKIYGDHVVRAIYAYQEKMPVLITVYFPYLQRYFEGSNRYEDKILK